jgi:hypothetical protein
LSSDGGWGMGATPHCRGWGGGRPEGAWEQRSRSDDGSGVPHGSIPARTGEGKGTNRWAGATVPPFESIQTGQVIQTLFKFKFKFLNSFEL